MRRLIRCELFSILLAAVLFAAIASAAPQPNVVARNGKVSVTATDVPLGEVLRGLGRKANVSLKTSPKLETMVSCALVDVTVEEAIQKLLADYNYALFQGRKKKLASSGQTQKNYLLWVYDKKSPGATAQPGKIDSESNVEVRVPQSGAELWTMARSEFFKDYGDASALSGQMNVQEQDEEVAGDEGGIVVQTIQADSPLARLGIAEGDVITNINGAPIRSMDEFAKALTQKALEGTPGLRIELRRGEHTIVPVYITITD